MNINRKEEDVFNHNNQHLSFKVWRVFLLLTFLLVVLLIPKISAVEIDMKQSFSQGETLLARFSGNFIDQITPENVFFYRGHVQIPMIYDVARIADDFYVYALLTDKTPGNYSISIEGVRYYKATAVSEDDIVSNFTISEETAAFSINPGVLITNDDFSIELQNLKDNAITVDISNPESITSESTVNLNTGQKKTISFILNDAAPRGLTTVIFSSGNTSYSLPVYLDTNVTAEETQETKNFQMEFQPRTVFVSLATDSDAKRILYLKNTGEETLEDIFFDISPVLEPYVVLSPEKINTINPGETEKIEFTVVSDLEEATIEGRITAYSENVSSSFTLTLDFIKNFIPPETKPGEDPTVLTTCAQLNGTICAENLECTGDSDRAKDGVCCLAPATCEEPRKSSTGKIVGWGLILLVIIIAFWFFRRKYRRIQRRKPF